MTIITMTMDDTVTSDEEIARALQEQFREEEEAAAWATAAMRRHRAGASLTTTQPSPEGWSKAFKTWAYSGAGFDNDAEVARRMGLEARDAAQSRPLGIDREERVVAFGIQRQMHLTFNAINNRSHLQREDVAVGVADATAAAVAAAIIGALSTADAVVEGCLKMNDCFDAALYSTILWTSVARV